MTKTITSESLYQHFTHFLERHSAQRLSRNLRTMLLEFLQHDSALEAPYLNDLPVRSAGTVYLIRCGGKFNRQ